MGGTDLWLVIADGISNPGDVASTDATFSLVGGSDLRVSVVVRDISGNSYEGSVTIVNMADPNSQVEALAIYGAASDGAVNIDDTGNLLLAPLNLIREKASPFASGHTRC